MSSQNPLAERVKGMLARKRVRTFDVLVTDNEIEIWYVSTKYNKDTIVDLIERNTQAEFIGSPGEKGEDYEYKGTNSTFKKKGLKFKIQ